MVESNEKKFDIAKLIIGSAIAFTLVGGVCSLIEWIDK